MWVPAKYKRYSYKPKDQIIKKDPHNTLTDHSHDWDNYWQGRSANESGNALLGVGIENNDVLTQFWGKVFSEVPSATSMIDFACGAGSVLVHAEAAGISNLSGLDVSEDAIAVLKKKLPRVAGYVGKVDATSFEADSFDMVTSQFGFEYAGEEKTILATIKEMTRILRPKGRVVLVAHIEGGAIESGCRKSLEQITLIQKSGFFESAVSAFELIYKAQKGSISSGREEAVAGMSRLNESAKPIMLWLRTARNSQNGFAKFGYYLLESTHKLLANHQKYELQDCLLWIKGMEAEVDAYQGRMSSMIKAAMSESLVARIQKSFRYEDMSLQPPEKIYFTDKDLPAAWVLKSV